VNKIPLYGRYTSGNPATLAAAVAQNHQDLRRGHELPRDQYPILPWTMNELPDTAWRNLHTFSLEIIQEIRENRYSKPGPDPDPYINAMFSIGLWSNNRFVIGHHVRVDHLPAFIQMEWHTAAIDYCGKQVAQAQDRLQRHRVANRYNSCYTSNLNLRKRNVKRTLTSLSQASQHATEFATLHHLPVSNLWNFAHLPMFSIGAESQ
jgi:hypothetical protein